MALVEVTRSSRLHSSEHLAFVLRAVGIASEIVHDEHGFALLVDSTVAMTARHHIEQYRKENRRIDTPVDPPKLFDDAWVAPVLFGFALVAIGYLAGQNSFGFDWYDAGALPSSIHANREWWRAITALTLHTDHQHLLSNIGFGALFSYGAARLLGSGVALFSVVFAAAVGNLLDSVLMPNTHVAIGASTAVFAALGLISGYAWHLRFSSRMRWAHRWAPLVVGIMLLGLLGSGGEDTDVLGHLTGFFCGVLLGVALAPVAVRRFENVALQYATGITAIAMFAGAWLVAGLHG